jgi:hypothetical protein
VPKRRICHWNEVHAARLWTIDAEIVRFSEIVTARDLGVRMMGVRAGSSKPHGPLSKPACLALHASKAFAILDDDVVTRVLAEREQDGIPRVVEGKHHS